MDEVTDREIQVTIDGIGTSVERYLTWASDFCESPIERVLFTSLWLAVKMACSDTERMCDAFEVFVQADSEGEEGAIAFLESTPCKARWVIQPQYRWRNYRIDFAFRDMTQAGKVIFFVEADGHDFHERTPEQAAYDRARDREAQLAGIPVLRFTGREIWRDPGECATQILLMLDGQRQRREFQVTTAGLGQVTTRSEMSEGGRLIGEWSASRDKAARYHR